MFLGTYQNNSGETDFNLERLSSMFVGIGKGKTETFYRLALQDIYQKRALVFIGKTDSILSRIPRREQSRVLYVNPEVSPFALNLLANVPPEQHASFARRVTTALLPVGLTPYREYTFKRYFKYALQTLLAIDGANLITMSRFLTDMHYRTQQLKHVSNPVLKTFWDTYATLPPKEQRIDIDSTLALLDDFILDPNICRCLFQKKNKLVLKDKIVIVEDNPLIVPLVLAQILTSDTPTTLYIDSHKYKQQVELLLDSNIPIFFTTPKLDKDLWGQVHQVIAFRTSAEDGKKLAPELHVAEGDMKPSEIQDFHAYAEYSGRARLITLPPLDYPTTKESAKILKRCALQCTSPREEIEKKIGGFFCTS